MESLLSLGTLHITQTMLQDISADTIKNHLMRYKFNTITLSGDSSIEIQKIIQPIKAHTLILDYSPNIETLIHLRTLLMISCVKKVIVKSIDSITKYLPFGTFESGAPGLFGAMIRNPNITKVIVADTENPEYLKKTFRRERRHYLKGLLTPSPRTKLRII